MPSTTAPECEELLLLLLSTSALPLPTPTLTPTSSLPIPLGSGNERAPTSIKTPISSVRFITACNGPSRLNSPLENCTMLCPCCCSVNHIMTNESPTLKHSHSLTTREAAKPLSHHFMLMYVDVVATCAGTCPRLLTSHPFLCWNPSSFCRASMLL